MDSNFRTLSFADPSAFLLTVSEVQLPRNVGGSAKGSRGVIAVQVSHVMSLIYLLDTSN